MGKKNYVLLPKPVLYSASNLSTGREACVRRGENNGAAVLSDCQDGPACLEVSTIFYGALLYLNDSFNTDT